MEINADSIKNLPLKKAEVKTEVKVEASSDVSAMSLELEPREEVEVSLRSLLNAGAHFGHQTSRWNPAMAPYIHSVRNGIHIINLPKTLQAWEKARKVIVSVAARGGQVLFVATKKQAQDAIIEEARRCGGFYVARRWLGGMMTNFQTVRLSIERMKKLETILEQEEQSIRDGVTPRYKKKERLMMAKDLEKFQYSLGGIRDMHSVPDLLFVIDVKREDIAIKEAHRLDIPTIALVDTNCNPASVVYPIPSNDDGSRVVRLFAAAVADAVNEGKKQYVRTAVSSSDESGGGRSEGRKSSRRRQPRQAKAGSGEAVQVAVESDSASDVAEVTTESIVVESIDSDVSAE